MNYLEEFPTSIYEFEILFHDQVVEKIGSRFSLFSVTGSDNFFKVFDSYFKHNAGIRKIITKRDGKVLNKITFSSNYVENENYKGMNVRY